jgi:hypothetical protein
LYGTAPHNNTEKKIEVDKIKMYVSGFVNLSLALVMGGAAAAEDMTAKHVK